MPDPDYEHFTVRFNKEYEGLHLIDPLSKYFIKKYSVTKFDFVLPNAIRLPESSSTIFEEYVQFIFGWFGLLNYRYRTVLQNIHVHKFDFIFYRYYIPLLECIYFPLIYVP